MSAFALTACGGSSEGDTTSTASGDPAKKGTVDVQLIADNSGLVGRVGLGITEGVKVAVKKYNADPNSPATINLSVADSGSVQTKAVSEMAKAVKSDADVVIFGPLSGSAAASAPIAQKAGLPTIFVQAGGPGVVEAGDHMFRVTGTMASMQPLQAKYFEQQGVKSVAAVAATDNPTLVDLEKTWPGLAENGGMSYKRYPVKFADTEFSAVASEIAKADPDAVLTLVTGPSIVTLIKQLHTAGWSGLIGGPAGMDYNVFPGMKKADINNISYATDFHPATPIKEGQEFVDAFKSATGDVPNLYNAGGFDAVTFLTDAIKRASDLDREGLTAGLTETSKEGFDATVGRITFTDRDAHVPGILVVYKDGEPSVPFTG